MTESWRLTLPCSRAEAELLALDIGPLALLDNPPVLMTSEPDPARPDEWRLDAYFDARPPAKLISQIKALVPSSESAKPVVEKLPEEDWVTLSQTGLEPITEGRFHVHTSTHPDSAPKGSIAFLIEAGRAFGTGQHATTAGCLKMIDRLVSRGKRFRNVIDLGTGTGVLAFAAARAFKSRTIATDIDPVSIEVAQANAEVNRLPIGIARGQLELLVANGTRHRRISARAPFDLVIANILAGPLIEMAGDVSRIVAPGGTVILAGLLDHQAAAVEAAYRRHGCRLAERLDRGEWPTLRLRKSR